MASPDNSAESLRAAAEAQERSRRAREESDRLHRERMAEQDAYEKKRREANERAAAQSRARIAPSHRPAAKSSKGSSGLLPVMGLVVVVIVMMNLSRGSDRQDDPAAPPQTPVASATPSATTTPPAPQPAAPVPTRPYAGFDGEWSADKAFQLVWPNGRYDPAVHGGPAEGGRIDSPVARIERTFKARYFGEDATVLLTSLSEGSCPDCIYQLSIFVFAPRSVGWELVAWKRNFGRMWSRAWQGLLLFDNLKTWTSPCGETVIIVPS